MKNENLVRKNNFEKPCVEFNIKSTYVITSKLLKIKITDSFYRDSNNF